MRKVVVAAVLVLAGCGSHALSGASPSPARALVLPTPMPLPTPTPSPCPTIRLSLPSGRTPEPGFYKCDPNAVEGYESGLARARWANAALLRTYAPLPAIAWSDAPAVPTPAPTPSPAPTIPAAPPCRPADLFALTGGGNGAMQHTLLAIVVGNRGDAPCVLRGSPGVRVYQANGALYPATYNDASVPDAAPYVVLAAHPYPFPRAYAPVPKGYAVFSLAKGRSCGWNAAVAAVARILLPGGGSIDVRLPAPAAPVATAPPGWTPCTDAPLVPDYVGWGPFEPSVGDPDPATSAARLVAQPNVPPYAIAGETLRFEVTLLNDGDAAYTFARCPNYVLMVRDLREEHRLACDSVPALAPGQSATFEMRIAIPAGWPVMLDAGLYWALEGYTMTTVKLPLAIARWAE